ncbi:MAG: hypothetical protein ACJ71Y_15020 [Blastococcus sp.]
MSAPTLTRPRGARTIDDLLADARATDVIGGFLTWAATGLPTT